MLRGEPADSLTAVSGHGLFAVIWILLAERFALYQVPVVRNRRQAMRVLAETWFPTWGLAGLLTLSITGAAATNLWHTLWLGYCLLGAPRLLLALQRGALGTSLARGTERPRTLFLGACKGALELATSHAAGSKQVLGFVPFPGEAASAMPGVAQVGSFAALREVVLKQNPELVIVCPAESTTTRDLGIAFQICDEASITINYFPSFLQVDHLQVGVAWDAQRVGLALRTPYNRSVWRLAKRALDFAGSSAAIVALFPVLLVCALAVKLTSRGPIFFRQVRVGLNGSQFTCLKFRSMRVNAQADQERLRALSIQDGPAFKIARDPRLTPIGHFLRRYSLDELPQLLNVWVGDMSLVGPRPPVPAEVAQYAWWQRRRIMAKPGLTCIWQVWGRNRVSFKRWVEMDLYYIDNWSLWMDLKLIAHTFRAVLRGTGM